MWNEYITAANVDEVVSILAERGPSARIVAGATDLLIEIEQGGRKGIDTLVDISRIAGLDQISQDDEGVIHISPMATHNQCAASRLIIEHAFPLAKACWEVGAPQIRNRGTVAGNLITASPANDTITPLLALGASVTLLSKSGKRNVPLSEFYTGVRKTVIQPAEMLVDISFPALDGNNRRGGFAKFGLRAAQAIAVVNVAVILTLDGKQVSAASITLGSVAPTVIHAPEAEAYLVGRVLDNDSIAQTAELAMQTSKPIDDIRGSAAYRKQIVKALTARILNALASGKEAEGYPENPILLSGKETPEKPFAMESSLVHEQGTPIITRINDREYTFANGQHKSLLRLLREEALLTGTKEGCAEGECGACTVFMDGAAVMSCLVPAPRAHGAEISTIEGVADGENLHPVQEAFVEHGAVQCGYCTPGLIMSATKLIEEKTHPNQEEIKTAISGNLCRCTGYHKIIQAIEKAGQ